MREITASAIFLVLFGIMIYLGKQVIPLTDLASISAVETNGSGLALPPPIDGELSIKENTHSSFIITKHYKYLNSTRVFNELKGKQKVYYSEYYYGTNTLREEGTFVNGNHSGVWRHYSNEGKLLSEYNYPIID